MEVELRERLARRSTGKSRWDYAWEWLLIDEGSAVRLPWNGEAARTSRYGVKAWELPVGQNLSLLTEARARRLLWPFWKVCSPFKGQGLDYYLFDTMVVHGEELAIRWLYLSAKLEPKTVILYGELSACDHVSLIYGIEDLRKRNLKFRGDWAVNGQAMLNRAVRARTRALKWKGAGL